MSVKLYIDFAEYDYEAGASWSVSLNQGSSGSVTIRIDETHPLPAINMIAIFHDYPENATRRPHTVGFNISKIDEVARLNEDVPRRVVLTLQGLINRLSFAYPLINYAGRTSPDEILGDSKFYECFRPMQVRYFTYWGAEGKYDKFISTSNTCKQIVDRFCADFGWYAAEFVTCDANVPTAENCELNFYFFSRTKMPATARRLDLTQPYSWTVSIHPQRRESAYAYDYKIKDTNQYYCNRILAYGAIYGPSEVEYSFNRHPSSQAITYGEFLTEVKKGVTLSEAFGYVRRNEGTAWAVYDEDSGTLQATTFNVVPETARALPYALFSLNDENRFRLEYNSSQNRLPDTDGTDNRLVRGFSFRYYPLYYISVAIDNEEEQLRTRTVVERRFEIGRSNDFQSDFASFEKEARERLAIFSRRQWTISVTYVMPMSCIRDYQRNDYLGGSFRITDNEQTYEKVFTLRKVQVKVNPMGDATVTYEFSQQPLFALSETFRTYAQGIDEGQIHGETTWVLDSDTLRFSEEMQPHEPLAPYVGANGMEPVLLDWLGGYASEN